MIASFMCLFLVICCVFPLSSAFLLQLSPPHRLHSSRFFDDTFENRGSKSPIGCARKAATLGQHSCPSLLTAVGDGLPMDVPSPFLHDTAFLSERRACEDRGPFALLILNCNEVDTPAPSTTSAEPVCGMPPMMSLLHGISSFVICADGGANRLYDMSGGGT